MNKYIIIAITLLGTFLLHQIITKTLEKKYTYSLMQSITEDEETFAKKLDSVIVKYLIPIYNREFFRLNYYIVHSDTKKVKEQLAEMENLKMTSAQHLSLYQTVFKYFITINKKTEARNISRKINVLVDENNMDKDIKTQHEMEIKIYLDKDIKTITYIDSILEDCSDQEKAVRYLEKTYIYKANDQLNNAKECMNKVIEYTTDEKQKQIFKDLLANNLKDL
ncbi:MAG: hypothetical protein IKM20_03140 [Erysipelotrichales bacterium]|nr:hypothetical protein [Erysipelotrichales bacterium]